MITVIGLTGGIGTGKSTVAGMLRELGFPVMDADVMSRRLVEAGLPAHAEIAKLWPQVLAGDGSIDRKRLAALVFRDAQARAQLEAILHPRIRETMAEEACALAAAGHRLAFFEAALLVETGSYKDLAGLIVVVADEAKQIERILARDRGSRESALSRIRAQLPVAEKARVADHIVDNNDGLAETWAQVVRIVQKLQDLPARSP
jgi:dephospho-CoA kinase